MRIRWEGRVGFKGLGVDGVCTGVVEGGDSCGEESGEECGGRGRGIG
jgi:hypothetical protein